MVFRKALGCEGFKRFAKDPPKCFLRLFSKQKLVPSCKQSNKQLSSLAQNMFVETKESLTGSTLHGTHPEVIVILFGQLFLSSHGWFLAIP